MKRILFALGVGVTLFAAVAFAATLGGITPATLGADSAAVVSCETNGVTVSWGTHVTDNGDVGHPNGGFFIHDFTVEGIASSCEGKYVLASLTTGGPPGNQTQFCISGAIPSGGGSVTFPNAYQDTYPALPSCLNNVTVWADDLTDVHIAIKDTPY